jgi:hypothetical protein
LFFGGEGMMAAAASEPVKKVRVVVVDDLLG